MKPRFEVFLNTHALRAQSLRWDWALIEGWKTNSLLLSFL